MFRPTPPRTLAACLVVVLLGGIAFLQAQKAPSRAKVRTASLSEAQMNFIRPGLVIKVKSASIAADGTITARLRLSDPKDQPLDRLGVETPGTISVSLIAARIPQGATQYVAYTTRTATSPITGVSAIQAGSDTGGTWTRTADGEYTYTFGLKAANADH